MNIRKMPVMDINAAKYNPRKDLKPGDSEYEKLKRSILEFGLVEPLVWNERTRRLVGGHQRLKVMRSLGHSEVEVVVVDLADDKEKALNLALNKIQGDWAQEKLALVIADLQGADFDLSLTGFEPAEIDALFKDALADGVQDDDFDVESELRKPAVTKPGDLWLLGRHRLVCGDATNPLGVANLLDGAKPQILITDPPYCSGGFQESDKATGSIGSKRENKLKPTVVNDTLSTKGYMALMNAAIRNVPVLISYIFTDWRMWVVLFDVVESAGLGVRNMIVWDKKYPGMGNGWRAQHELIMFAAKTRLNFDKKKGYGNVLSCERTGNPLHPTQKPLGIIENLLINTAWARGVVDLFGGSGTTLVACERKGQECYVMEIDEKLCDVIVKRYIEQVGGAENVFLIRGGVKAAFSDIEQPQGTQRTL